MTGLIMPSDETSGAKDAGVVFFIDHSLATWAAPQRQQLLEGLTALDAEVAKRRSTEFASLRVEDQIGVLQSIEGIPFFQTVRFFTLLGMFSLPLYKGNKNRSGWRMIGFEDRHVWEPPFGYYDAEAMRAGG